MSCNELIRKRPLPSQSPNQVPCYQVFDRFKHLFSRGTYLNLIEQRGRPHVARTQWDRDIWNTQLKFKTVNWGYEESSFDADCAIPRRDDYLCVLPDEIEQLIQTMGRLIEQDIARVEGRPR